ncbi:MAG: hypothetical protein IPJ30_06610 [Acidobacteria bacterium]|nr:hypothetical protein [Acidobacteriota bacterium]
MTRVSLRLFISTLLVAFVSTSIFAQTTDPDGRALYEHLKAFDLTGGKAEVSNLVLQRDRGVMTFTGTFYFTSAFAGRVTGAVFVGQGSFKADVPPSDFEKANVKRMIGADVVESDFKTAILRFSDDTFDIIGKTRSDGAGDESARKLAADFNPRLLKETGANIASRVALSIVNNETPGFFCATFDGGKRERFSFLLDHQTRIPTAFFEINGGEKGMIFAYRGSIYGNDIWMAFYNLDDYQRRIVAYSDQNDLVDIESYRMTIDLRTPKTKLGLRTTMVMSALIDNVRAITFSVGESLGEFDDSRLKKQLRLKTVRYAGSTQGFVQEDWEGGFTVFLGTGLKAGQKFEFEMDLEGDFVRQPGTYAETHYPRDNSTWYPHHGYLDRATYDMTFWHSKSLKIAANGVRQSETLSPEDKDVMQTRYTLNIPVSFVTFALAPFKRQSEEIKWDNGDKPILLEYNSVTFIPIKEDFILAELNNSVRYFHALFGKYPYENYGAAYHPFGFGQGFPSMLMIPDTDYANKYTFAFIAHETAHQWWGNIVAWRSYRDQWLSEGFAEYSGVLYTAFRKDPKAARTLVDQMRDSLKRPPETRTGIGKGKLFEVGPVILGHRLDTSKTYGAYEALIYNKGALILRMLHFLFTDPNTGNGDAFYAMMKDFVERHRNKVASTDDFRRVAGEHFGRTPIGKRFGITDLDWFFHQWVYESGMPSYSMEYTLEDQPDGSVMLSGTISQENVPDDWAMVLPVVIDLGNKRVGMSPVAALGPKRPFKLKLPSRPQSVELDPDRWVLSEKTTSK